jgi:hypothetical protein
MPYLLSLEGSSEAGVLPLGSVGRLSLVLASCDSLPSRVFWPAEGSTKTQKRLKPRTG